MTQESGETGGESCCCLRMPTIPLRWLLFIEFAFTFGTTIVYFADIVTDIITLKAYYDREWYYAFGFSIGFIVVPSILLAVLECQFLLKMFGKNVKWGNVIVSTLLNIPFQLTVIWYHFKLSYRYLKVWLNNVRHEENNPIREEDKKMSMSNLADLDDRANTLGRRAIMSVEVPASSDVPPIVYPGNTDQTWWKELTREEWLSHLNKMKLIESMLESLPQLLINLYLIVSYQETPIIQYISATISYLSLCGGIVRYDKTRKDNEADRLMVDRTLLHSRAFTTRLEWPQILFLSLYKGFFLAARILVFVYFTVYFQWYVLVFVFIHWAVLMCYLVYLWYPTDIDKKTKQLVQADYKFRAYMFLSQDCFSVFLNSLIGIFVSVRPQNYGFLGQPYCYLFWFYFAFIIENIILFLIPGVYYSILDEESMLVIYQYYIVLIFELTLNVFGAVLCTIYYFSVHKMSVYTRNAYPSITKLQKICCCSAMNPSVPSDWTVCKQSETSEIFFLRRENLKQYKNSYNTVVRGNRQRGRNLECFIDERGKIFYAPRRKLFKKLPTPEEEEWVDIRRGASKQSLNEIDPEESSARPDSRTTANERLVGEDSTFEFLENPETEGLLSSTVSPPPLPSTPPQSSTPIPEQAPASLRSSRSARVSDTKSQILPKSHRDSNRSKKSQRNNNSQVIPAVPSSSPGNIPLLKQQPKAEKYRPAFLDEFSPNTVDTNEKMSENLPRKKYTDRDSERGSHKSSKSHKHQQDVGHSSSRENKSQSHRSPESSRSRHSHMDSPSPRKSPKSPEQSQQSDHRDNKKSSNRDSSGRRLRSHRSSHSSRRGETEKSSSDRKSHSSRSHSRGDPEGQSWI
ncbi:uncharacterized protein LOC120337829 [Styela clava]